MSVVPIAGALLTIGDTLGSFGMYMFFATLSLMLGNLGLSTSAMLRAGFALDTVRGLEYAPMTRPGFAWPVALVGVGLVIAGGWMASLPEVAETGGFVRAQAVLLIVWGLGTVIGVPLQHRVWRRAAARRRRDEGRSQSQGGGERGERD